MGFIRLFARPNGDPRAVKSSKTLFLAGKWGRRRSGLRRRSGRRRWFLLPKQSYGNCHQCNKHKAESFVHETPFGKSCYLAGHKHPLSTIRTKCRVVSRQTAKSCEVG